MGYTFLLGLIVPRTLRQEELQKTMRERVKWKQVRKELIFSILVWVKDGMDFEKQNVTC
jgi:hypothetical protein